MWITGGIVTEVVPLIISDGTIEGVKIHRRDYVLSI